MKIIFTGTSEFALSSLKALLNSQHKVCAIYTQPDRHSGRGQKIIEDVIKKFAIHHNLPIYQPLNLKDIAIQKELQNLNADVLINISYGMILPEAVLNMFRFGCINIHPSLLPRWRGAAPIQRAIMAADKVTGVTIMKMDAGLDTGDIYKQEILPIKNTDTTSTLLTATAELGAKLLLEVLSEIELKNIKLYKQDDIQSTYANKISKEEGRINWHKSAQEIDCIIRAFNPWPIAYTEIESAGNKIIRLWQAEVEQQNNNAQENIEPGIIIQTNKNGIKIATGSGILNLLKIQFPGKKPLQISDALNAYAKIFNIGKKFVS